MLQFFVDQNFFFEREEFWQIKLVSTSYHGICYDNWLSIILMYLSWEYFSLQVNGDNNQPLGWRQLICFRASIFKPHSIFSPVSENNPWSWEEEEDSFTKELQNYKL